MLRKSVVGTLGLIGLAGFVGVHGCATDELDSTLAPVESGAVGEVGLELTLPDGVTLNALTYTVTGGQLSAARTGSVNLTNSSQLRFRVGDLPVATGYAIALGGTTSANVSCAGTASFDVANNTVSNVLMTLVCGTGVVVEADARGDISVSVDVTNSPGVSCPVVTGISALPLETRANSSLALTASVSASTGGTLTWSGAGGTFSATNTAATSFLCLTPGDQTLSFAVSKAGCPTSTQTVAVTCSTTPAYVIPVAPGVTTRSIITVGESYNAKADGTPYRLVGLPDGIGAFDNNDGTFTLLSNHELGNTAGIARAHGGAGAFVSRWTIRKSDLGVVSGSDLIQTVQTWNTTTSAYQAASNVSFGRFCSADLAARGAFFNAATNLGFNGQLFLNGEETGNEGRALAHGLDGVTYELPRLGKASWENQVASPFAQDKTIVVGLDDSTPGELYVYVGTKTSSGTPVARAGLTNGTLYGVTATGFPTEPQATGIPSAPFTLASLGNVENTTGAAIQTASNTANVTKWNRPEDGAWDPANPRDFYFVTTNGVSSPSRLWRLRFNDIAQPELGGTVEMMLDGTEGQVMFDNLGIDGRGHIMLQEDPGNNSRIARVYRYDIATDRLTHIADHNPALFTTGAPGFITQDEEASGIIDASALLGNGYWLLSDQIHAGISGELAEMGQISVLFDPGSAN